MICPRCRGEECYRSHRSGLTDFLSTLIGLRPWRCHSCGRRFYGWKVAITFTGYAHCPRCGNFDLERISRDRVDHATLLSLKRFFGIPAYRCDPCRERFFSPLPYRRIVPTVVPGDQPKAPSPAR